MASLTRSRWLHDGRRRVGLLLLVVAGVLTASCTTEDQPVGPNEAISEKVTPGTADLSTVSANAFRIGVVSRATLDPAAALPVNQAEMLTADLLFDALTSTDPKTGAARPSVAYAWTVNDAQTTWRFAIGDTRFSDGRNITAADAKASLERVARETLDVCKGTSTATTVEKGSSRQCLSLASQRLEVIDGYREFTAGVTEDIRGLQAVEEKMLQIDTREPFSPLPELLASPNYGIVPKDAGSTAEFDRRLVTSGAYSISQRGDAIVRLEKSKSNPSPTAIERVELVHFFTFDGSYQAFKQGKLDWTQVPQTEVPEATGLYGSDAVKPFAAERFFVLNVADSTLANDKLREAMAKAADRIVLAERAFPGWTKLNGAVPSGVPGVVEDACEATCAPDPAAATALVAEAFPEGDVPEIEIAVGESDDERRLAEGLREQWASAGIKAKVSAMPREDFQRHIVSGKQQVFALGWVGLYPDPDAYLAPLFLSGSLDNLSGLTSEELDGGLKEARGISDREVRIAKYADMQRAVMKELPIIPLVSATTNAVVTKRIHGYTGRIDGTFDVDKLEMDL